MPWTDHIAACASCPKRDRGHKGPNGYTICTVSGREFMEHCREGECPEGRFSGEAAPSRGLGDTVAKTLRAVGVKKKCGGCAKRQANLNQAFPYKATDSSSAGG